MSDVLTRAVVDGAIFAAIIWVFIRLIPRLTPGIRTLLWWLAAARFAVSLVALPPVPLPVLQAERERPPLITSQSVQPLRHEAPDSLHRLEVEAAGVPWGSVFAALWIGGICVSFGLGAASWKLRRRLVRESIAAGPDVRDVAGKLAALLRLRSVPEVRISPAVGSPLITGVLRPVMLLPDTRFSSMPADQQRMALCHELVHVKRGDLWLGLLPAVVERVFFFHPFARLAAREYGFWREVACDRAVLEALGTEPQSYGQLLLDLGVAAQRATLAPAGAAWSFSSLKRRIVMLKPPSTPTFIARFGATVVVAIALFGLLSFELVTRPSAAVILPPSAAEPVPQSTDRSSERDELNFVFLTDEHTTMSGSMIDIERARQYRKAGEDLLWFRKDGKEYVVRDPAILGDVRELWIPVSRLGAEQGALGAKQGALGAKQGEIGAKQGELGAQQGAIGSRQGAIGARQAELGVRQAASTNEAERADLDRKMRALDADMRALDREMRALDDKMRELNKPMEDLGAEMDALGRDMDVLGDKMEAESKRADEGMKKLLERAIASGAAQLVR